MKRKVISLLVACFAVLLVACTSKPTEITEQTATPLFQVVEQMGLKRASAEVENEYKENYDTTSTILYLNGATVEGSTLRVLLLDGLSIAPQTLKRVYSDEPTKHGKFTFYVDEQAPEVKFAIHDEEKNILLTFVDEEGTATPDQIAKIKAEFDKFK